MPRYEYFCPVCDYREDQIRPIAAMDAEEPCPACGTQQRQDAVRANGCVPMKPGILKRDAVASMKPHTETGFQTPMLSDAAGIHPSQIAEAKRRFPDHEFTPSGQMVFRSLSQRRRHLRDIGMVDWND